MDANDSTGMNSLLAQMLELKAQQRRHLANLPIEEKLVIMERLRDRAILLRDARRRMIPQRLLDLAKKHGVSVEREIMEHVRNFGLACEDRIVLSEFDDADLELVAFYHELGHVLMNRLCKRGHSMCTLSREGMSWELGLEAAAEDGYRWEYQSKEMDWARTQLKSYADSHK